jgi:exonuclease III
MKAITWNVRRATRKRDLVWDYFNIIDPDIALLQEVGSIPEATLEKYSLLQRYPINKKGNPQKFQTALLVKGSITKPIAFTTKWDWVNEELEKYDGNIVASEISLESGKKLRVMSVYSPAWPVFHRDRLKDIDASVLQLENNPDFWLTELLWGALQTEEFEDPPWIIGGDFNASATFDTMWSGGPRGNQEIMDRMSSIGLTECLKFFHGKLTPTFRNPKGGKVIHQMDHLFVPKGLIGNLVSCTTGNHELVFGNSFSDHLPIIAEFKDI